MYFGFVLCATEYPYQNNHSKMANYIIFPLRIQEGVKVFPHLQAKNTKLSCRHLLYPGRIRTRVSQGRPKLDIKIDVHMWFSVLCMFNIHKCIIHHINQNFSADAKMYHTCVYVEHTWSYDHICTQFWRSFSGSATIINLPLKILDTEW